MGGEKAPVAYRPKNEKAVDASISSTMATNTANDQTAYNTAQTGYNQAYDAVLNNPYNASAQAGANSTAATYGQLGATDLANAATLNNYAPAIIAAGFDPLSANYNFGLNQATDAQKVANAQAGVAGSPFSAGTVADAGNLYTMNYNAQTQQRQQQAIAALASLFGNSSTLGAQGAADQGVAATLPQSQYNSTQATIMQALDELVNGLGAASAPIHSDVTQGLQYIQTGTQATQAADQAVAQNNAQGGLLGAIGSVLGGGALSSVIGGGGSGGILASLLGQTGGAAGAGAGAGVASLLAA